MEKSAKFKKELKELLKRYDVSIILHSDTGEVSDGKMWVQFGMEDAWKKIPLSNGEEVHAGNIIDL